MGSAKEFDSSKYFFFAFWVGEGTRAWVVSQGCEIRDTSLDAWASLPEEKGWVYPSRAAARGRRGASVVSRTPGSCWTVELTSPGWGSGAG